MNDDGTKTVVSYRKDPATSRTIKVTQKIKTVKVLERVDAAVAERKGWAKFGSLAKGGTNMTSIADEVKFSLSVKSIEQQQPKPSAKEATITSKSNFKCRTCGGEHFTTKCPLRDMLSPSSAPDVAASPAPGAGGAPEAAAKTGYVAPHLRNRAAGGAGGVGADSASRAGATSDRDDMTLRVTNLGEDVIEDDLRELFGKYGAPSRVNILRDRETGRSRGFGFVVFNDHLSAQRAQKELDHYPYENLIMKVEFANKRT